MTEKSEKVNKSQIDFLKPCPCGCGVHPVIYDYDGTFPQKTKWIKCPVCGWSTDAMTLEHCIEQWNRRVE